VLITSPEDKVALEQCSVEHSDVNPLSDRKARLYSEHFDLNAEYRTQIFKFHPFLVRLKEKIAIGRRITQAKS